MKELSIEEKARRYDEAIKRAQAKMEEAKVFDYDDEQTAHTIRLTTTDIFPELKESEDEKIRKEMIEILKKEAHDFPSSVIAEKSNSWIAYLEKQGEHANFRNTIQIGDKVTRNKDGVLVNLSQLKRVAKKDEKQGEQKPADTEKGAKGNEREIPNSTWSEEDEQMLNQIIKDYERANESWLKGQGSLPFGNRIIWLKSLKDGVQPQPKQEWSEEDEAMWAEISDLLWEGYKQSSSKFSWDDIRNWVIHKLKSLRPQKQQQEGEWSEEDKEFLGLTLSNLAELKDRYGEGYGKVGKCMDWLKSLRPQNHWKPSDLPYWKKSTLPNDNTTGFNSDYFCYKGYNINYKELFEKLPKDD